MTFSEFSALVLSLHDRTRAENAYLDALPSQVREFIATNQLSEQLYAQRDFLCEAVFGEHWPDVNWFLFDWKPGFCIVVGTESAVRYEIHTVDDYLAYAEKELFTENRPR